MPTDDPHNLPDIDQQIRINELKEQAREAAGGHMTSFESSDAPPELLEGFWKTVNDFEKAPPTSDFEQLTHAGFHFPFPEELTDEELHHKLWELIRELAKRNTFLYQTDHLSDRELYTHLLEESLHQMKPDLPEDFGYGSGWCCTIDLLGGYGEEEIQLHHTYYTDDQERAEWLAQFPDYVMPPKKPKPHDRDRLLPIPRHEQERRDHLAELHAQGYADEDIHRMYQEEAAEFEKKFRASDDSNDPPPLSDDDVPY